MKILKYQHGLNLLTPDKAVQIAKQKLDQWYNDPTTLHMMYWSDPARNELTVNVRKKQHGWKDVTDSKGRPVTKTFSSPHEKYQWEVEQGLNSKYLYQKPESEKYPNATGMYHPRTGVVEISPESKHPQYTAIHEYDHAIQDRLPSINKPIRKVEHKLRSGYKPNEYLDKPEEIRSRIMQARVYLNLDPKKRNYTKEDADKMQQQLSTSKISSLQQLYRLDPETMAGYLNYLAEADEYTDAPIEIPQNNTYDDLNDNVLHASKGGSIHIKKKNRGKFTDYCGGKVTQECIEKGKKSTNPTTRKRAIFADNARKWKHQMGGIIKAQEGTGNLYAPHPLSPVGIALNQAKAIAKMKGEQQHLPPGVKEVVGPDGKKVAIRTEQPLQPLEQSIAEWLPGTGDVAEVEQIANDVKNGNLGSAILGAGLLLLPGNAGKLLKTNVGKKISNFLNKDLFNYDELWARIKHPTWQKYYHGSPKEFDIKNFHKGTVADSGLHMSDRKEVAEYFAEAGPYNPDKSTVYEFYAPKPTLEFMDLHSNGINMLSGNTQRIAGNHLGKGTFDGTPHGQLEYRALRESGGEDVIDFLPTRTNDRFGNTIEPYQLKRDVTIPIEKYHWPNRSVFS